MAGVDGAGQAGVSSLRKGAHKIPGSSVGLINGSRALRRGRSTFIDSSRRLKRAK